MSFIVVVVVAAVVVVVAAAAAVVVVVAAAAIKDPNSSRWHAEGSRCERWEAFSLHQLPEHVPA